MLEGSMLEGTRSFIEKLAAKDQSRGGISRDWQLCIQVDDFRRSWVLRKAPRLSEETEMLAAESRCCECKYGGEGEC